MSRGWHSANPRESCSTGTNKLMSKPKPQFVVVVIDTPLARWAVGKISEQRHQTTGPHE
jgi:hypothetical protein